MTEVSRDSLDTLTEGGRGTLPSVESLDVQSIRGFCDHIQEILYKHLAMSYWMSKVSGDSVIIYKKFCINTWL